MRKISWLLVALVLAGILYGSLYPFSFRIPAGDPDAFVAFVRTWNRPPQGRGDLLANILFYIPLGFALGRALEQNIERRLALALTVAIGAGLSLCMELLQYFDVGRDSSVSDVYLNTIGTAAGAVAGIAAGNRLLAMRFVSPDASLFAGLLLIAWLGWRLFPYEPVIDLHKYWASVKPVVFTPSLGVYDIFRFAVMWSAVAYLMQFGLKVIQPLRLIPLGMIAVFLAKMLIIDQVITLPDLIGAIIAFLYLLLVMNSYRTAGSRVLAVLFLISIALERILPLQFAATQRPFEWIPFFGFLHGSLAVNAQSFMQKVFLYGAGLYLLLEAGVGLIGATILEGLILLATSFAETMLVARSAEITDAVMVLFLAVVAYVLAGIRRPQPAPVAKALAQRPRAP